MADDQLEGRWKRRREADESVDTTVSNKRDKRRRRKEKGRPKGIYISDAFSFRLLGVWSFRHSNYSAAVHFEFNWLTNTNMVIYKS